MDRLIRVHVLDNNGRSIPDASVSVFVSGAYIGKAISGAGNAGTVYTFQISDSNADVSLKAEYKDEASQEVTLAQGVDHWKFVFNNVEVPMPRGKSFLEEHIAGVLGVGFLLISIGLAIVFPNAAGYQYRVFVATLAIAIAGVGAEIPGFLNVKLSFGKQLVITAAGAIAIFVLVYFYLPA